MEIGSEFWLESDLEIDNQSTIPNWLKLGSDNKLLLSGRTSIDYILKDIIDKRNILKVYFPSYACDSMLQPFIDTGIEVIFYKVYYENGLQLDININQECDLFFAMNYFGYSDDRMGNSIKVFKEKGVIVIEDITHSLLSEKAYNLNSDYLVASLRKWFPIISGGIAVKTTGSFKNRIVKGTKTDLISIKQKAMMEKAEYINGEASKKNIFMEKYILANKMLKLDYRMYDIDSVSLSILNDISIDDVRNRRNENVRFLYQKLGSKKYINFFCNDFSNKDCLLALPIILSSQIERDDLRAFLIENDIFCPVHWPRPKMMNNNSLKDLYELELSFVIDQRYKIEDLEQLVRSIEAFYE